MNNRNSVFGGTVKRFAALLLVLFILLPTFPAISIDFGAAEADVADTSANVTSGDGTWISGKLIYEYSVATGSDNTSGATGSVSASSNTLTVKATSAKQYDTGGCNSTTVAAAATTTTVTVTNTSSYPLKFNSLSTTGSASVAGVSQGDTIASDATFTITVTSPANGTNNTEKTGTVTVSVSEETSVTITLKPSPYIGYTVNNKTVAQNGSEQSFTVDAGTSVSLPSISAPSGYKFAGWRVGSNLITGSSFTADAGYDVFPVIVAEGTDTTSANFKVGSNTYTFWEDAVRAAVSDSGKIIVNLAEVTLPDNALDNTLPASGGSYVKPVSGGGVEYIIPLGVTLVVPKDTGTTVHTTAPEYGYVDHVVPTPFRTLSVPNGAKITVDGAVSVDSKVSAKGQNSTSWNGTPTGPHGKIVMKSGSEMTLNAGANLYCYGYINGDGNLYVKSGAKVYELFQFRDWRGGSATSDIEGNSERIFPMNQYYVQNVEAPMVLYKGATEYVWSVVNMSSSAYPTKQIEFIGANGMFKLTGGSNDYLTKRYRANVDRLEIAVHGNMSLNALNVTVTGLPLIGTISMDSSEYVLPLNNMEIVVENGTTSIDDSQTYGVAFLPSSKLTVNDGATFTVNAPTYFYDTEDWGDYAADSLRMVAVGYSTANGATNIRTADNLQDAELDVNGTVNVSSKLYTTEHGANLTSSNGTGSIKFTVDCASVTNTTYQYTQSGTSCTAHPITCNNAWLLNGDESYSKTVSTGTSTWKYDKSGEHWYRHLVDFNFNGNTIKRDYYCENNDTVTYDASWLTNLGATASNGTAAISGTDVNVTGVTADSVVTLTGTPAEYVPTFVLSEEEYQHYKLYNSGTLDQTTTINGETYYIVDQASSALAVGTTYAAPTDEEMGVSADNHNDIIWNMSGLSYTSGDPYRGIVPAGDTAGAPVYIYGFYNGAVAYNSYTDQYYPTLIEAFEVLPQDVSATITLLADCGTYEEESGTVAYTAYTANNITLDLDGHHATGRIVSSGTFTLELNGGTFDYVTGATAAAAGYDAKAAVTNSGTMTIQDTAGGGKITSDAIAKTSGIANYSSTVRNNEGATLTVTGVTLQNKPASVNNYSSALQNFGTATVTGSTLTTNRGICVTNSGSGHDLKLKDTTVSVTLAGGSYGVYNTTSATMSEIDNCTLTTLNTNVIYNYNGAKITTLKDTDITVTTPTTANVYAVFNYGGTITTMDHCTVTGNSGINNRNQRTSAAITAGYALAYKGTIGTIKDTTVNVGMYAVYNGGTINTMTGSTFTASPASAQVPWSSGTPALNGNSVHAYTVVNSNLWWYDSAVWKRTDTTVKNGDTTMLQRRVDEYKTEDAYKPSIGTITDCTITANNTSTSNSYGYFALQNLGVINTITGSTTITAQKHPNNAKTVYGYYAVRNEAGGKIGSIGSGVTINANNYALGNIGARYSQTDTTYSTTYMASGALASGKLATDYDYTSADVSEIGSTAATISATSQYAILNYSKIGSITGTISGNYNVIVNAGAAGTTTGIEGTTANSRAIEHRYFTDNDSSTTANEYRRYFEYTRNTTDGCYIGTINATVTATGAGYQAISNQGYIGTLAGTVSTPTGKATSSSTYYPLIYNGDQRQATLKQTEDYYVESNGYGATKYLREYTYDVPTIDTISCTATNPQDYTIRNLGTINTLSGTISGKTITVANEASGTFRTRKTITYYSSASRLAATKGSSEVNYEYTKDQAKINTIDGATLSTTGTTLALRNFGYVGEIKDSTITSTTTNTIQNGAETTNSTVTSYISNRLDVLTGCTPSADACALAYDQTKTINEEVLRSPATINKIGAGNYFQGTYFTLYNMGRINEIDSGSGKKSIIYGSSRQALYNLKGCYSRVTNTDAVLTNATGTTTNNYTYEYAPAYIGTIKNVFILGKRQAILNGDGTADYCAETPVTIGEIGEGTEARTSATATYSAVQNYSANARIGEISGGVYMTGTGSGIYGLKNDSTTYPILVSGGDFRGGDGTRALAILEPDKTAKYTYPAGASLSTTTKTATYHTLSNKVLTAKTNDFYYIPDTFAVTFNKQGHGDDVDEQRIAEGSKATQPESPEVGDIVTEGTAKFRFDGWYTDDTFATAFNFNTAITADTTVYAKWSQLFTITWVDGDGAALKTEQVAKGDTPAYTGVTPTKTATAQYTYTFNNTWNPAITAVTGDATYTAQFTSTVNEYDITWVDGDGNTIKTDQVAYGATPSYTGDTPTKTATDEYTYTFNNTWSPDITAVTGDASYTAQFSQTTRTYTITWKNYDGSVLKTDENVSYNSFPAYSGETPTKPADAQYTYQHSGWTPLVTPVTGDATYTATYTSSVNKYTITWLDGNGDTLKTESVAYGQTPSYTGDTPTKTATAQYSYTFTGWTPEIAPVTGDVTYTAVFTQTVNTYTVQWVIDDSPSDEELKTAVDALIAEVAQNVYNDAKTEGDMIWDMGWMSHEELVKMHLNAGHVGSDASAAYIAKRIIEIVDNNSADFSAADALWDSCKDTVASDFASFSGYTGQENGTVYSGLTPAQKSSMEALSGGKTILEIDKNVPYGTTPSYDGDTPTKEATAQYTYTFDGWTPEIVPVTGDATYTAQFTSTVNKYDITWVDGDGNTLKTEQVEYGATPSYTGDTPTKTATAQYSYTFNNAWSPAIETVTGDATYTAQFSETTRSYTVTWMNGETAIETDENVLYGTTPSYDGADPTKASTDQYDYTFTGWSPAIETVTGDATYTAQFSETTRTYTVTWMNGEDVLKTEQVEYGQTPTAPADPTKEKDGEYSYTSAGWSRDGESVLSSIPTVTGDATYTAVFTSKSLALKHSLTLDGEIGVKFYIPKDVVDDKLNSTVKLSWGPEDTTAYREAEFNIKDLNPVSDDDPGIIVYRDDDNNGNIMQYPVAKAAINGDFYQFIAYVSAKQMADDITLNIRNNGQIVKTDTYRVADYCNEVIENKDGKVYDKLHEADPEHMDETKFTNLQELCKAMLTYGAKAQDQFDYNTENYANADKVMKDYTYNAVTADQFSKYYTSEYMSGAGDMAYYGASMQLEAETTYTVWLRYTNAGYEPPTATAKIGNENVTINAMKVEGNYGAYHYVRYNIMNLPAKLLTEDVTVSYNGEGGSLKYNAGTYFYIALSGTNDTLKNTVASLYNYNQAAVTYFDD